MSQALQDFLHHDFTHDSKWNAYFANIYIAADANQKTALDRIQRRWYKANVNPAFDVNETLPAPASSIPSAAPRAAPSTPAATSAPPPPRQQNPPETPRDYAHPYTAGSPREQAMQLVHFILNFLTVVFALVFLFTNNAKGYRFCLLSAAVLFSMLLFDAIGLPRLKLDYLQRVLTNTNGQYLVHTLIFLPGAPLIFALLPVVMCAAVNVAGPAFIYIASVVPAVDRHAEAFHRTMARMQMGILKMNAQLEIVTILALGARRSIVVAVAYAQLTMIKYHVNPHTRALWNSVGLWVDRLAARCPRPIEMVIRKARGFFTRLVAPAPRPAA
ncbi:hypothetical protein PAPYR_3475 [Paratrimastix pyriformis]|uniref:Transmembrane protein n=1 Tax=Paratrimastix pyriformis TaxID=342808 RepID=A0ABQ8UMN6_9EUKA|nr:hypothetical protein PAPYR_3475 [Paratrimastix pyriformis]